MRLKGITAVGLALVIGAAAYASEQHRLSAADTGEARLIDTDETHDDRAARQDTHVIGNEVDVTN